MCFFRATTGIAALVGAAFAISTTVSITVGAATLNGSGLLVDTGSGYRAVSPPMELKAGASIIANPGGRGEIRYEDGCIERVRPGDVANVKDVSPCAAGVPLESTGFANRGLVVGALVVGGGAIAAVALSGGGGSDKPKSP